MKQLLQNMRDGKTVVAEVPCPAPRAGAALIRTAASLVSAGTERMVVEFGEKSLLGKARSRPDLVRQVLDKARREGLLPTIESAFNRLDQPMPLGYSSAGVIVELGAGMDGFKVGDRVACAGGGFAVHAEYAIVPRNLLTLLPDSVSFEEAAFTTLGAIAMHGFRLSKPQLGESVAVIGMGLLGLLAASIARAAGCHVFGVDRSPDRIALGRRLGFDTVTRDQAEAAGRAFTHSRGFDHVLICADTRSSDPVELAGLLARDRASVVAVGAVGLSIPRKVYYDKELNFIVSRSYGPGRYDAEYEERGRDYPAGFVRWTEGRNFESFVDLLANRQVDVAPLITHRFSINDAGDAYALITGKRNEPFLGVLLTYPTPTQEAAPARRVNLITPQTVSGGAPALGVLGAGNYATAVFLPNVQKVGGVRRLGVATSSGLSARHAASKFGFEYAAASEQEILDDPHVNVVAILTRHQHHARQLLAALRAGKAAFCEKPLGVTSDEIDSIEAALAQGSLPPFTVGFNRRFAPLAVQLKGLLTNRREPLAAHFRVNAGFIPANHWVHDALQGGGRIIGEGCHFIDFLTFLTGSAPAWVSAAALPDNGRYHQDNVVLTFGYPDGSLGTVSYLANGDKSVSKERIEVFCGGLVTVLDDFRRLEWTLDGRRQVAQLRLGQDKGHRAAWAAFLASLQPGAAPLIPYAELLAVSRAAIAADALLRAGDLSAARLG